MKLVIGCDHGGFELKNKVIKLLKNMKIDVIDVGADSYNKNDDFSYYAKKIIECKRKENADYIIAICGSGVGMSIAMNRCKDIFCVNAHSVSEVELARKHNNINALALGGRNLEFDNVCEMIKVFVGTEHLGGKYKVRMDDINNMI